MSEFVGFCDFLIVLFTLEIVVGLAVLCWMYLRRQREHMQRRAGQNYVKAMNEGDDLILSAEEPIFP